MQLKANTFRIQPLHRKGIYVSAFYYYCNLVAANNTKLSPYSSIV